MALDFAWNTVTAAQNDADSPLTEDWGEAMRQNDIHLRQTVYGNGSGGFHTAVDGHQHTGSDSRSLLVGRDDRDDYDGANTYTVLNNASEETTTSLSYVPLKEILVTRDGTIDTTFQLKRTGGAGNALGKIYLNGSPVGIERSRGSISYQAFVEDIAVTAGDLLQLYVKRDASAISAEVQNFSIRDGQPFVEISTVSS